MKHGEIIVKKEGHKSKLFYELGNKMGEESIY